jgi:N-acylneuraminate cytidylyltransferase/CMP-N,N'-diacetyllegionaminic acid synthase
MIKKKNILAIITARKGSKGVKNKNIKKILGKPLIYYTFDFLKKNKELFSDFVLTTNSEKIINYASSFDFIKCPFKRPANLSTDTSKQEDAVFHILSWFKKKYYTPDYICIFEPTTPLRNSATYLKAISILNNKKNLDGIFSIMKSRHAPELIKSLRNDFLMKNWNIVLKNRQEYPDYYTLTSSVVIIKTNYFIKYRSFISPKSFSLVVDQLESLMIDDKLDFMLVKSLIEKKIKGRCVKF